MGLEEGVALIGNPPGSGVSVFVRDTDNAWNEEIMHPLKGTTSGEAMVTKDGEALIANQNELYLFDLCVNVPSVSPTSTSLPLTSSSPSQSPSMAISSLLTTSSSPSQYPSISVSPTETCYSIDIEILFDDYPEETLYDIERINANGADADDNLLIRSHQAAEGDTSHKESICLQEGEYVFTIHDDASDGICCQCGEGNYIITTSNGASIAGGGAFESSYENTHFSIPFGSSSSL